MPEGTEAICSEKVVNDGRGYPKDCDPEYQDATWVVSVCPVSLSVGTEDHPYRSLSVDVSALNGAVLPNLVNPNLDVFGTKHLINWPPASWRSRSKGETYEYLMQPPQVAGKLICVTRGKLMIMAAGLDAVCISFGLEAHIVGMTFADYMLLTEKEEIGPNPDPEKAEKIRTFILPEKFIVPGSSQT